MTSLSTAFPERILARAIAFLSLLLLLLSENKNGPFLFARAAVRSETWPLGIYKNQTIAFKNFNTDDDSGTTNNEGVGEIMFEASVTSLTKGDLILGSANHASASDGTHTVGAKILALQAQLDAITTEVLGLTPPSPPPAPGMFFTAVALSDDGGQVTVDIGETAFNEAFQLCPLVKYVRNGADHAYYHRITDIPSNFDAYSLFTYTWKDTNNVLGTDFDLFDTLDDLRSSANKWQFCNYNDPDVGFPRDCGKETGVANTWFSMPGDRFNARGLEGGASFEMWSGGGCPGMVDPIPSASWAQFVEECLEENGAKFTGECTEWASTNNYRTMPRWDTSLVEDMSSTFTGKNAFNGDISKWNTEKVTKMNEMFSSASAFNQNIGNWNTSQVNDMHDMFYSASAFNQGTGSWNTTQVTDMSRMFAQASVFNQDIGGWNTEKVKWMDYMFNSASAFNQDIGSWNTAQVADMRYMFRYASAFNQDIGSWNTTQVTDMEYMFYYASAFNQDISSWTGSAATTAQTNMFLDASAFQAKFACTDAITGPANSCFERLVNLETCSVLYEAISPVLPFLKAATVDFPADHSTFGSNYAYYVYAEITTGSTFNSYEDVYLLGGTSHCGSWFGGLYHGRPFIGTQCNWGSSTAVGVDQTTATVALQANQTYRIQWMYNVAEGYRRAQIKVDGVVVVDSTTAYLNVDSSSTEEFLSIGSGYHTQVGETLQGSVKKVSVHICGENI